MQLWNPHSLTHLGFTHNNKPHRILGLSHHILDALLLVNSHGLHYHYTIILRVAPSRDFFSSPSQARLGFIRRQWTHFYTYTGVTMTGGENDWEGRQTFLEFALQLWLLAKNKLSTMCSHA